jgi:uncharacterized protein with PIN domain
VTLDFEADNCPRCDAELKYVAADGETYSRLIGIYSWERDRTVAWRCPFCESEWDR